MKKSFRKIVVMVLALVVCVTAVVSLSACKKNKKEAFIIGMSGPLTGEASVYGIAVKNAVEMAIEEINAKGGIQFQLKAYDDKHDASNIESIFSNMLSDGVSLTLGTVTTKPGMAFNELAKENNMFFMTPSASANAVVENYSQGYQMCFADNNQGKYAAEYVKENYAGKNIGAFYNSADEYSKGIYTQFEGIIGSAFNIKKATFTDNKEASFETQVDLLKDCDVIFMPIYYTPAQVFINQAKEKVKARCVYFGCDGLDGISGIDAAPQEVSMLTHFDSSATTGKAGAFNSNYTKKYGAETLNQFGASAYDTVYAIYEAMTKAGITDYNMSHSDICDKLCAELQNDFKYIGSITGGEKAKTDEGDTVSWDSKGFVNKGATRAVIKPAK